MDTLRLELIEFEGKPAIQFSDSTVVLQSESLGEFLRVCETLGLVDTDQLLIIAI